jgi:hypothetical protein
MMVAMVTFEMVMVEIMLVMIMTLTKRYHISFLASNFQVFCDNDYMTAVFDRADLPKHVNIDRLYLRDRYCRAYYNSTHVIVKTPLTGCGTVFSKDEQSLYFSNVLSEEGQSRGYGVITRDYLFKANMTCTYPQKRTVGSFSFAPAKQRMFVSLGKCTTLQYSSISSTVLPSPYWSRLLQEET